MTDETEHACGWSERWQTSADGLRLFARDYAGVSGEAKPPVVLVHGLTRNSRDFEDLAPVIASWGRRVIAPDVRGRGRSDRDPNPLNYHPGVYAADVAALLDKLGVARAQFLGTSMGGLITMALATFRGELIAGAVLNDVGPVIATEGLERISAYVGQPADVADWSGAAAYVKANNAHALPHYDDAAWARMARRVFRDDVAGRPELDYDLRIADAIRAAAGAPAPDLWPYFDALATGRRLLVVRGATSDLLDAATVEAMRARAPQVAAVEVPGVGHAPMLDEPEALAAIRAHLDAVP